MKKRAYFILSTQRSGSTLLCRDMASTQVMGTPDEHMIKVLSEKNADIDALFSRCCDSQGNFGLKLMANYLDEAAMFFNRSDNPNFATALHSFSQRFDEVIVIYITRDDYFDQALSRIMAKRTNSWHDFGKGFMANDGKFFDYKEINNKRSHIADNISMTEVNKNILSIFRENEKLSEVFESISGDNVKKYKTNYNEIVYSSESFLSSIYGERVAIQRSMKKVTDMNDVIKAKKNYFLSSSHITSNDFIDTLRDAALHCEKSDITISKKLMSVALSLRPLGAFLIEKMKQYSLLDNRK